jgi:hypothetical protein
MGEYVDLAKLKMVTELDVALHGETVARNQSPQEVWRGLLNEVKDLVSALDSYKTSERMGYRRHGDSLERDIASDLNYWSADSDLDIPDHILAEHLVRHLNGLRQMQHRLAGYQGTK